ncbi:MAG: 3-oxoacid CoA-transferase subunit B [Rhodospirillales bacterium]|nr:3-oxoacid CoA-transferase subunit B [Rhodospirillales bacterium]
MTPLSRDQMAWRVAQDLPGGSYVNLGVGIPELVSNHLPEDREVVFHCENGILGMGPMPEAGEEDFDLITAGKKPVTLVPGGAFIDSADAFAMIRGGHIDITVLGAFQVSATGDLANWATDEDDAKAPAVGGAMDLAAGARKVFVITDHVSKTGAPKLVEKCTYPLTAKGVVGTVFTDLAVIDVGPDGFSVRELVDGLSLDDLAARTGAKLSQSPDCKVLRAPMLDPGA